MDMFQRYQQDVSCTSFYLREGGREVCPIKSLHRRFGPEGRFVNRKKKKGQVYKRQRGSQWYIKGPLKPLEHHDNNLPKGFKNGGRPQLVPQYAETFQLSIPLERPKHYFKFRLIKLFRIVFF